MKVIIAGGRNYKATKQDWDMLVEFVKHGDITEVVSGLATGADQLGIDLAIQGAIELKTFAADWDKYGKSAGPIRNRQMAQYADAVILFPGGRGTANMRELAKEYGLRILCDAENAK